MGRQSVTIRVCGAISLLLVRSCLELAANTYERGGPCPMSYGLCLMVSVFATQVKAFVLWPRPLRPLCPLWPLWPCALAAASGRCIIGYFCYYLPPATEGARGSDGFFLPEMALSMRDNGGLRGFYRWCRGPNLDDVDVLLI